MVKQNLFPKGTHESYTVNRMEGELSDLEVASINYELVLLVSLDIILLSPGMEGHIASLFPGSHDIQEKIQISHANCRTKTTSKTTYDYSMCDSVC